MKFKVFSVYDSKAEAFLPPFFLPAVGQAIRGFTDAAGNLEHPFGKHPADYTLFQIGSFDDSTGFVTCDAAHVNLGTALTLRGDIQQFTLENV